MTIAGRAEGDQVRAASQANVFDKLWRLFTNVKLAVVLILVIAASSFVGSLLPQVPESIVGNSAEYARWLTTNVRPRYGVFTHVYSSLGLFDVYRVFWFKILLVTLIFNTVICTVNRLPALWRTTFSPGVLASDGFLRNTALRSVLKLKRPGVGAGDNAEAVFHTLSRKRYKIFFLEENGVTHFYADKFGVFRLGTLATHFSLVVLMVGTLVGGMFGFVDDSAIVPEGQTYQVGFGESFSVRCDDFTAEFWDDGRAKDYYSDLTIIDGGREVLRQRIRVNEPLEYKGVRFHQAFYGPVANVEVKDSRNGIAFSDAVALSGGTASTSVGWLNLPSADQTLILSLPRGSGDSRGLGVQLFEGDKPVALETLKANQPKTIGDLQVTLQGISQFTGLRVVKDPGAPIVWLAAALLVIGASLTFYLPRRRLWGRIGPNELTLVGSTDRMSNFRPEFERLVDDVRQATGLGRKAAS
ncbi:MAG: cytochrome c biogenesis protein ResB [Chloroflexi bacterium]|nr:cytochrome c biogenesis protein ResB [Chloroflexota bacterium]